MTESVFFCSKNFDLPRIACVLIKSRKFESNIVLNFKVKLWKRGGIARHSNEHEWRATLRERVARWRVLPGKETSVRRVCRPYPFFHSVNTLRGRSDCIN